MILRCTRIVTDDVENLVRFCEHVIMSTEYPMPKLFVAGEPGALLAAGGAGQAFCSTWPNQQKVTVNGRHFLQEDSHSEIGAALRLFVNETRRSVPLHSRSGR
jgi:haloalkane dehalogenase